MTEISRRGFLKLFSTNMLALAFPPRWYFDEDNPADWPALGFEQLPRRIQDLLAIEPKTFLGFDGHLELQDARGNYLGSAPQARTQWNLENSKSYHRLNRLVPWGIVLHWYGDRENFDRSIKGYLRGFDSLRKVEDYLTRTSAHFLVGDHVPTQYLNREKNNIGIIQTQAPDSDGTPFVGSHLKPLDYQAHKERKQYFVKALYQLSYKEPAVHSMLQDFFDGPVVDPNMRTIAIEITGYDFDNPEHYPSDQKIANVLSLVWAVMKRYGIPASNLMGHNEIQMGKADPGKGFLALIRYLLAVKALLEDDEVMKNLIFGQFLSTGRSPQDAVREYFSFVHNYLTYISTRRHVYDWEVASKYWLVRDLVCGGAPQMRIAQGFCLPILGELSQKRYTFINPQNHEGVDLHHEDLVRDSLPATSTGIHLVGDGLCLYAGNMGGCCNGKATIFRHRQASGGEVLSIYSHLSRLSAVVPGTWYEVGHAVGEIKQHIKHQDPFLHFAVAYGATWQMDLQDKPSIPLNAGPRWIRERFLEPVNFLDSNI
jgi:hypothetical protein